ncbi:UNVERIFIED_ORG: hypothetical protein ABID33_000526 [Xanthobacter viscosus]|nr:hypothetical protein [Xanthobacter autotrophicus]
MVYLAPGSGLPRRSRRITEASHWVSLCVRGEGTRGRVPNPNDFDQMTLKWMVRLAGGIIIWSAPGMQRRAELAALVSGSSNRRALTIETTPEVAPQWRAFAEQWKRPGVVTSELGPLADNVGA